MRFVMEISGARTAVVADTECGDRIGVARIVDGNDARKSIRRNGRKT